MRIVFDKLTQKNTETVRDELKALFKMNNIELARNLKNRIIDQNRNQIARMVECLDEGFEACF